MSYEYEGPRPPLTPLEPPIPFYSSDLYTHQALFPEGLSPFNHLVNSSSAFRTQLKQVLPWNTFFRHPSPQQN